MITIEKKKPFNPMLMKVIIVSVGLHVVAGFIAGVVTIATHVIKEDAQFEEPPAVAIEEPPPEVKVEIKPQQPQQQNMQQQLKMKPVANIAVAQVDVNLPNMTDNFTVSAGLGGLGGGNLLGGASGSLGIGMSNVNVFGLKTRAERIVFVIDANRQMVTDAKGGLNSYKVIKDEITDMVGNLSAGTLFNVILQDRRKMMIFKPKLVAAGSDVHQELVTWITQVNSDPNKPGLEGVSGATVPKLMTLPDEEVHNFLKVGSRSNETAFITQVALEQNADAIFFIAGYHRGFEDILSPASEEQVAKFKKLQASKEYQEQLAAHKLEIPRMQQRINAEMAKINEDRAKKGLPPRVLNQRHGIYSNAGELGFTWQTRHPGHGPGHQKVKVEEVQKYFKKLIRELYTNHEKTPPSLNVVLFLAGDEEFRPQWADQLKDYVRFFKGKNRVIRGEDEIKSARSSKDTKN